MNQHFFFQEHLFVDRERKLNGFGKLLRPEISQAVMLVEAEEKMGKSWLAAKLYQICLLEHEGTPAVHIDFENPLDKVLITDHQAFIRLLRNRIGFAEFFAALDEMLNRLKQNQQAAASSSPLAELARAIQSTYTPGRLEEMARFLDVDWENLEGNTHFNRAFFFVRDLYQRNDLEKLFERLYQERAHINWEHHAREIQDTISVADRNASSSMGGIDEGRYLVPKSEKDIEREEQKINEVFFDALAHLIAEKGQLVFLFDTFDSAPRVAQRFIITYLIPHLLDARLKNMVIVITGRKMPDLSHLNIDHLLVRTGLEPFTEEHIHTFMTARSIQENPPDFTWKGVLRLSGGIPGELARMADRLTASTSRYDPFFDN